MVKPDSLSVRANASALALPCCGGVAAADDGERGTLQELDAAPRVKQRRRIGNFQQQPRIGLVGKRNDRMAGLRRPRQCMRHRLGHGLGIERSESGGGREDREF